VEDESKKLTILFYEQLSDQDEYQATVRIQQYFTGLESEVARDDKPCLGPSILQTPSTVSCKFLRSVQT
jgi:hypothetical protein